MREIARLQSQQVRDSNSLMTMTKVTTSFHIIIGTYDSYFLVQNFCI